jgi:uncharacterized spore protein YtfJ
MTAEKENLEIKEITVTDPGQAIDMIQETLEDFIETADVKRVYGEPVLNDDTTIISAAEVLVGMGFGASYGAGSPDEQGNAPGRGGGGGGGRTFARPVAVVIASPEGVRVEPVLDATKIALTFFTSLGFILTTLFKMVRLTRQED